MSRIKNPQEKKRLAYEHDFRDAYGEPPKAWRKLKPLKKAKANRAFRKASNDLLQATLDESDVHQKSSRRKLGSIKKKEVADFGKVKLGSYVKERLAHRRATIGARKRRQKKESADGWRSG